MTAFDLAVLTVVLLVGALGYATGAIRQLTHWVALAVAYFAVGPLATLATPEVAARVQAPPAMARVAVMVPLFVAQFLIANFVLSRLLRALIGDHEADGANHAGGLFLGIVKGAACAFGAIAVLLFFEKPLTQALGAAPAAWRDSAFAGFVRQHNPLESAPPAALEKLKALAEAARDPKAADALLKDPKLKALLDDPALKSALGNDALLQALRSGDVSALEKDPRVSALLKDPRFAPPAEAQ